MRRQYIERESIDNALICKFCNNPFFHPITSDICGHTFCEECFSSMKEIYNKCYECNNTDLSGLWFKNFFVSGCLDEFEMKCIYPNCIFTGKATQLLKHESICIYDQNNLENNGIDKAILNLKTDDNSSFNSKVYYTEIKLRENKITASSVITVTEADNRSANSNKANQEDKVQIEEIIKENNRFNIINGISKIQTNSDHEENKIKDNGLNNCQKEIMIKTAATVLDQDKKKIKPKNKNNQAKINFKQKNEEKSKIFIKKNKIICTNKKANNNINEKENNISIFDEIKEIVKDLND